MNITIEQYHEYMFLIEQEMLNNKMLYNKAANEKWDGWEETCNNLRERNKQLRNTWFMLNKPENGTPNGCAEFYAPEKQRYINNLIP